MPTDKEIASRVASRVAAEMDEKMQALLLKLRKGADSSLTVGALHKVLAFLGGWKIAKVIVPVEVPTHKTHFEGSEDFIKGWYERLKAKEAPLPTNLTKGQEYITKVDEPDPPGQYRKEWLLYYKAFKAATGFKYTAPNGKTFIDKPDQGWFINRGKEKFFLYDLRPWLKKETPYLQQISEKLAMPTYEEERENKPGAAFRTRENTGTCPCCFRNIKLKPGDQKIVLHGYKRPGWGSIHGSCYGVGYLPFELSKEGTVHLVEKVLVPHTVGLEKAIEDLKNGKTTIILRGHGLKPWKKDEMPADRWAVEVESEINSTRRLIDYIERDIKLLKDMIADWKLQPLPFAGDKVKPPPRFLADT